MHAQQEPTRSQKILMLLFVIKDNASEDLCYIRWIGTPRGMIVNPLIIERINWMADTSEKGIRQSAGIMVNYVYRLEKIEENAQSYFSTGHINASSNVYQSFQEQVEE